MNALPWVSRTSGTSSNINAVAAKPGKILVVTTNGQIRASADGITWTLVHTETDSKHYYDIIWTGSTFLALTTSSLSVSADGVTWTDRAATGGGTAVTWTGSLYVTFAASYDAYTSPDAITWTLRSTGSADTLSAVLYENGIVVAAGSYGTIYTSPTGVTWTQRTNPLGHSTANNISAIAYGNSLFVAVGGGDDGKIITSPDGITWTDRTVSAFTLKVFVDVIWNGSMFIATATDEDTGDSLYSTSLDGITWSSFFSFSYSHFVYLGCLGPLLLAVSSSGSLKTSYAPGYGSKILPASTAKMTYLATTKGTHTSQAASAFHKRFKDAV